jgi:CheY-like chemotaxis protein
MTDVRPLVLIIDDEAGYLWLLENLCSEHGFEVITAESAGDGIQKAVLLTPQVILMDVTMAGQTGWEALRQLKTDPRTSAIPVVMMTGHLIDISDPDGPHVAAWALLTKPIMPATLIETLQRALIRP